MHRPPPAHDQIDQTLEAPLPDCCPDCGGEIAEDDEVDEQFQDEIPIKPIRRKIRIHKGTCRRQSIRPQCSGRYRLFQHLRDQFVAGKVDQPELLRSYEDLTERLATLSFRPRLNEANERLAKHIYKHTATDYFWAGASHMAFVSQY